MIFEKAESLASMKPFLRKQNPAKHMGFHGVNVCTGVSSHPAAWNFIVQKECLTWLLP